MTERSRELLTLVIGDILCFLVALWCTLLVRYFELPSTERIMLHLGPFALLSLVWVGVFLSAGLYDKHTILLKEMLRTRIVYAQLANIIVAALVFMFVPLGIAPKTNLVIYLVVSTILISVWRLWLFHRLAPKNTKRALLIADGPEAVELVDEINNNDRYGYSFVRIIDKAAVAHTTQLQQKLTELIERENITIIVVHTHDPHGQAVIPRIFELAFLQHQSTYIDFIKLYEDTFDRVPISSLHRDWFIEHVAQTQNFFYDVVKRMIDLVLVVVLCVPALIIMAIAALAIWLEDRGPLLYRTERIGQGNRPFILLKFRTKTGMDTGAEALQSTLTDTRVGRWLRTTRIDELPQLWNVLRGELSFIGPRPEMPALAAAYAKLIPFYSVRHRIKPGLSGWAQINDHDAPRNGLDVERTLSKLSYDLLYLKRRSLRLDLQIMLRTLATLVMRSGR